MPATSFSPDRASGFFDLTEPGFVWRFVRGQMQYQLVALPLEQDLAYYREVGRGVSLQWLDLVDGWAQFGMPLFVFLRSPTGYDPEAVAGDGTDRTPTIRASCSCERMRQHVGNVTALLLSRPSVQGVVWSQWRDPPGGPYPASGLVDAAGQSKPIVEALQTAYESTRPHTSGDA